MQIITDCRPKLPVKVADQNGNHLARDSCVEITKNNYRLKRCRFMMYVPTYNDCSVPNVFLTITTGRDNVSDIHNNDIMYLYEHAAENSG